MAAALVLQAAFWPCMAADSYALVAGTVFRETGMTLAGAEVTVASKDGRKFKEKKVKTDARGEFAVRVPPQPIELIVTVRADDYQPQRKEVSVAGPDDRIDVFLRLEPASKGDEEAK
jgi:hypothetical protein